MKTSNHTATGINRAQCSVGDFVKYDGEIWIIAEIETPPMSSPLYWLVDQHGNATLWSSGENVDGYLSPLTSAEPGRTRAELVKQAQKFQKRRGSGWSPGMTSRLGRR